MKYHGYDMGSVLVRNRVNELCFKSGELKNVVWISKYFNAKLCLRTHRDACTEQHIDAASPSEAIYTLFIARDIFSKSL